jgi:hypothetical protein
LILAQLILPSWQGIWPRPDAMGAIDGRRQN